eukprot:TRINITY_DN12770_c0_g1_i2.p1 TRINITY_DN12770_c0_g1~~TRINITY_DN12770_c0_g1_i2.p1  ORF type:complete len:128 (-),score=34.96 TRINITY_DN12770_c0_g1_i2:289-672(-)
MPRSIDYLFDKVKEEAIAKSRRYTIYCSFLQIYNERIFDLLNIAQLAKTSFNSPGLKLRQKDDRFFAEGLYTFECRSSGSVHDLLRIGLRNRAVAERLNHSSSRSHSILTLTVESTLLESEVRRVGL